MNRFVSPFPRLVESPFSFLCFGLAMLVVAFVLQLLAGAQHDEEVFWFWSSIAFGLGFLFFGIGTTLWHLKTLLDQVPEKTATEVRLAIIQDLARRERGG